jgi:hypothetical protein
MDMQTEQATVDLVLEEDEEYLFEIVGKKHVHLDCSLVLSRSNFCHSTVDVVLTGNRILHGGVKATNIKFGTGPQAKNGTPEDRIYSIHRQAFERRYFRSKC